MKVCISQLTLMIMSENVLKVFHFTSIIPKYIKRTCREVRVVGTMKKLG